VNLIFIFGEEKMKSSSNLNPLVHAHASINHRLPRILHLVLFGILILSLVGCSSATATVPAAETGAATEAAAAPAESSMTDETPAATGAAGVDAAITLKVGVSPVPHGDILRFVQENLAAKAGLNLDIVEFSDYVQPNTAVAEGELDANFFQHVPYLNDFNKEHSTNLVPVVAVHIEPLGIYSKKIKALADLPDKAQIAIPNDATNGGRALNLLQANGLITLKEGAGTSATVKDITANPKNLKITELEAAQLVRSLDDVTAAVINGNYALEGNLIPSKDALALENGKDNPYANVLVVNSGHENVKGIQILAKLLTSPEVKKFIEDKYQGSVIPAF
jgi:D-methionine transport system substrate-binding protein